MDWKSLKSQFRDRKNIAALGAASLSVACRVSATHFAPDALGPVLNLLAFGGCLMAFFLAKDEFLAVVSLALIPAVVSDMAAKGRLESSIPFLILLTGTIVTLALSKAVSFNTRRFLWGGICMGLLLNLGSRIYERALAHRSTWALGVIDACFLVASFAVFFRWSKSQGRASAADLLFGRFSRKVMARGASLVEVLVERTETARDHPTINRPSE